MIKQINFQDRIFVAGAKGMAGSAVCRTLLKKGYCNKKNGGLLLRPGRKDLDLTNFTDVEKWFTENKPNVVVLAAAKVGGILANKEFPTDFILENIKIQTNVIEAAWKFGTRRLLFLGSSCIYPKFAIQPIKEDFLLNSSLEETNEWYAVAKISGLKLCEALRKQHGFDAISLMPTNLYGPGDNYDPQSSHVMASLISKFCIARKEQKDYVECWGTGSPLREFLHVDDLGSAVVFCLENWDPNSPEAPKKDNGDDLNHLNVGTGKDISIFDLAIKISKLSEYQGEIIWDKSKPNGTPKKQLDIKRISKLGWKPKINLDEGIKETIKLYTKSMN